ncbi:ABC transporter permease [Kiloniella sp. EL199]|uniref:ABC transporter permease n=1 Tax=Kiloniella sp. EL199 TaxID=2107581 RepID=UPI000EA0EB12|nr:ABC transporter permease [Kiloniella sp. EL199]
MPEEKVRVLKEGLPSLHDMETDDLVDYLLQARQSFVTSLNKKDPPLDERSLLIETANFDEAVRRILSEKSSSSSVDRKSLAEEPVREEGKIIDARDALPDGTLSGEDGVQVDEVAEVSLDQYLSDKEDEDEDVFLLEEKPLFAEQPLLEKLTRARSTQARDRGSNTDQVESTDIGMEQGEIDLDDFSSPERKVNWQKTREDHITDRELGDRDPSPYVWDSDIDERSRGGFLGFVSGLIVLIVYIILPGLAVVSPLLTPAMAWDEWINIGILSGIVLLAVFVVSIFSRYRFRYALYGGIAFALLSYGAHHIPQVRDFVENEKIALPIVADYLIEGYFLLAEESQLPLKTGAVQLQPNELNYGRLQRVNLFVKEVDAWLEN